MVSDKPEEVTPAFKAMLVDAVSEFWSAKLEQHLATRSLTAMLHYSPTNGVMLLNIGILDAKDYDLYAWTDLLGVIVACSADAKVRHVASRFLTHPPRMQSELPSMAAPEPAGPRDSAVAPRSTTPAASMGTTLRTTLAIAAATTAVVATVMMAKRK